MCANAGNKPLYPWLAHYPREVPNSLEATVPLTLPDLLERAAARFGDRIAMSMGDKHWTYREMKQLVARAARGLQDIGVASGDRVAVLMSNHAAFPIWFFGAAAVGAVLVNINPLYPASVIEELIRDSGARVLLTLADSDSLCKLGPLRESGLLTHTVTASPDASELNFASPLPANCDRSHLPMRSLLDNDGAFRPTAIVPEENLAVLQYTGGTTGAPKGAMLTHANLTTNALQIRLWFPFLEDGAECFLVPLPFSHITGITVCVTLAVLSAAEVIIVPRFAPQDALTMLRNKRPTFFGGVPTIFIALLQAAAVSADDWKSVKCLLCGGAPLPAKVLRAFEAASGTRVRQIYGSTELSPAATIMPARADEPKTAVGLPLPGTAVEIRDLTDPRKRLGPLERGEIVVAGPQLMKGYWKREADTANAFVDGFFRTGDIGYLDEKGYLFVVDRLKDMIIVSGYNVYPANVEHAIYSHPAVAEAVVIGVPDAYKVETVKAFVVLRAEEQLTLQQLQAHLKDKLSPMEMPRHLEIRQSLPKTVVGKLSRRELQREVRESQPRD